MSKRRTKNIKRAAVATLMAGGVLAGAGFVAGEAGAQTVADPVSYEVGDVDVFGTLTRNPSCSITRSFRNGSPLPMLVIAQAEWDGHPAVFPTVGDSAYTEPTVLGPGEQLTAVWNGVDRDPPTLSAGPVRLLWNVVFTDGSRAFAAHVEFVPACETTTTTPSTASEIVPTSSAPPVTDPPDTSVTQPAPDTTTPPPDTVVSGPAPSIGVAVETQLVARPQLPETGSSTATRLQVAGVLLAAGGLLTLATRRMPQGDRELGFEERG